MYDDNERFEGDDYLAEIAGKLARLRKRQARHEYLDGGGRKSRGRHRGRGARWLMTIDRD
jgi:hypothetical protein